MTIVWILQIHDLKLYRENELEFPAEVFQSKSKCDCERAKWKNL